MSINIGFVGFGLIAGSIAKAIKYKHQDYKIYVYNRRHPDVSDSLLMAKDDGTIDGIYDSLGLFCDCDIIFLCAPVIINISYLKELKSIIKDTCILTDVGSVKGNIHKAVNELSMGRNFIGGHPMTGSDRTGYGNSSHLFMENAYYLLTPTKEVSPQNVRFFKNLVEEMGSIAYITDCDKHDEITAAISHLPHIIASSLVNVVRENDDEMQLMKTFAAGGFKDITRIASSSPEMWQSICLSNPDYILRYIDIFTDKLKAFKSSILAGDSDNLYETFEQARNYRNSIASTSSGALSKTYEIYVDVPDVPGIIAIIATILSSNSVNIRNIGIVHNREFEEGVLRIEFNNEKDSIDARNALLRYPYRVYDR